MIVTPNGTWGFIPAMHESIGDGVEALRLVNMQLGGMGMMGASIRLDCPAATSMVEPVMNPRDESAVMRMWEAYVGGAFLRDPTPGFLQGAMAAGACHGTLASDDFGMPETSDYLRWHHDEMQTHWIVDWRLEGQTVHGFALHRPLTEAFTETDAATLRILCGHLLLAERLARERAIDDADRTVAPVFLIDGGMRVYHRNAAAERLLATDDGIGLAGRRLACRDAGAQVALQRAAVAAASLHGSPEPRFVLVPGGLSDRPKIAAVTPVRLPSGLGLQYVYGARVRVIDSAAPPTPGAIDHYAQLFDLTPAEQRVTVALMTGGDALPVIADRLGISYNTARTHIGRVLAKTGVASQSALVRLLTRLE